MIAIEQSLGLWIPKVQGQYINEDWNPENRGFGAQCWDLIANWSGYLGLPVINTGGAGRWPGWAGNMVDAFPQSTAIAAAYELHGPGEYVKAGDILVWDDSYPVWFPKTHVAVAVRDLGAQLLCVSQNSTASQPGNPYPEWTTGPATIQHLPRRGLLGIIRPRTGLTAQGTTTQEDIVTEEQMNTLIAEIRASRTVNQQIEDVSRAQVKELIAGLNGNLVINTGQAEDIVAATAARVGALSPTAIADLIPANIAQAVATELAKRLVK